MADDIAINRAQRTTLFSLQQIDRDSAVAQRRLSFGRKIVDVTDGATEFFQARSLSNRIGDVIRRNSEVEQAIRGLQTIVDGGQTLQDLIEDARGILIQAETNLQDTAGAAVTREGISRVFAETLRNLFETTQALDYNGLNLLVNDNREFRVRFSNRQTDQLVVNGRSLFTFGAHTLDKGNLFTANVIDGRTGALNFSHIAGEVVRDVSLASGVDNIVISGGDAATVFAGLTSGTADTGITFTGSTLSVGETTEAAINGATTGSSIGPDAQFYDNVDQVVFDTKTSSTLTDNGDGTFTITDISNLALGAGTDSDVVAGATHYFGFSTIHEGTSGSEVIDRIRIALDTASERFETIETYLGSNISLLQERLSFGITYSNNLTVGRDQITLADVNAEAAILTTLRTRNQIGIGALASNAESEQQLLRLLS